MPLHLPGGREKNLFSSSSKIHCCVENCFWDLPTMATLILYRVLVWVLYYVLLGCFVVPWAKSKKILIIQMFTFCHKSFKSLVLIRLESYANLL